MAPKKNNSLEIPDGWVLRTRVESDGTEVQSFFCPETEQEFSTYEKLMRYVRYAKAAKVSIYAPDFQSTIPNEVASSKAGKKRSSGKSSKSSVTEQVQQPGPHIHVNSDTKKKPLYPTS
ncbi:hypothetical protein D8674_003125 [Pyrus ussuriensis x Pyrus communis]|uniref:MBD domain-containing protein n=1 Tax=Pyrus ussuriensis x Pyrus communis TaxID=2448454 RepID=A0A5N5FLG2_9ROSA|nr:hypothetical protein D8674_003125 [Pyrus ussuriensis x Pyrus communis]